MIEEDRQPRCSCGRPVNGTILCRGCAASLESALVTIISVAPDLDIALARQAQFGDPAAGSRNDENPLPFDARISEATGVISSVLAGWCDELWDVDFTRPRRRPAPMAMWLLRRLPAVLRHDEAARALDEIAAAAAQATRAVDRPPERLYAGPCGACHRPLYVKPGRNTATCNEHDPPWTCVVADRREWMLSKAASVLAHAAGAVRILAVLEIRVAPVQITRWAQAGRLTSQGADPNGRTLYRVGDLISLAVTPETAAERKTG